MRSRCGRFPPGGALPSTVTIKPSFVYVLHDSVWDEIPDRLSGPYALSALGRGDRQRGHFHQADTALGKAGIGEMVAGPGTAYEMRQPEELIRVTPRQHLGERVGPRDEVQLDVGPVYFAHLPERVDRIREPGTFDVDAADREPRIRCGRDDRHQVAILGRRGLAALLHPGLAGRHEDDLVQPEQVGDLTRGDQVAVVDRIE